MLSKESLLFIPPPYQLKMFTCSILLGHLCKCCNLIGRATVHNQSMANGVEWLEVVYIIVVFSRFSKVLVNDLEESME